MAERLVVEDFTSDPAGAEQARLLVGLVLRSWDLGGCDVWGVETAVGALVSAGVWGGCGAVSVSLQRHDSHVVVEVCDPGDCDPRSGGDPAWRWQRPGGAAVGLVDQLADAWGTRTHRHGTSVWLVKHITPN